MFPALPTSAWVAPHDTIAWTLDAFTETPLDPQARADFPDLLVAFGEGSLFYGYPDEDGNITIGRGNKVDNLAGWMALGWTHLDGTPASAPEAQTAWLGLQGQASIVKANGHDRWPGGGHFAQFTTIRATKASIDALIQHRLDEFDAEARAEWPGWDVAPPPAQSVLMRLYWACGAHGPKGANRVGWPKLWHYWCAKQWGTRVVSQDGATVGYTGCASECRIPALDRTEPGANDRAQEMFASCTDNAPPDTEPATS